MQLEHSFEVPVPVEDAWAILLDVERVAPCMPGASLDTVEGDEFTGKVKVKVGPIQVTYTGRARFVDRDDTTHTVTIDASGKEVRGSGTAKATVRASLTSAAADRTRVDVVTDLAITGRPAQFGRGVMVDVGGKIIGQFARCLEQLIQTPAEPATDSAGTDEGASPVDTGPDTVAAAVDAPATEGATAGAQSPITRSGSADAGASAAAVNAVGAAAGAAGAPGPSSTGSAASAASASAAAAARPATRPAAAPQVPEAIDLLGAAGVPVLKRLGPVAALVALLLLVWRLLRRRS